MLILETLPNCFDVLMYWFIIISITRSNQKSVSKLFIWLNWINIMWVYVICYRQEEAKLKCSKNHVQSKSVPWFPSFLLNSLTSTLFENIRKINIILVFTCFTHISHCSSTLPVKLLHFSHNHHHVDWLNDNLTHVLKCLYLFLHSLIFIYPKKEALSACMYLWMTREKNNTKQQSTS